MPIPIIPAAVIDAVKPDDVAQFFKDMMSDCGTHCGIAAIVWISGHKLEETEVALLLVTLILFVAVYRNHRRYKLLKIKARAQHAPVWIGVSHRL